MIVGNEIHGLKVKHLHVGGVLGSGEVQNGIKGCIQVKRDRGLQFLIFIGWREPGNVFTRHKKCVEFGWGRSWGLRLKRRPLPLLLQGVRLGVRPDAPPLPRPSRAIKVESGCNVGNPCISSPCPGHSRCSDQWERHTCVCEPGEWTWWCTVYDNTVCSHL